MNEDGVEKVENQQLGLIVTPEQVLTVSLSSNLNFWVPQAIEDGTKTPSLVVKGHSVCSKL